jgi:serine protease AprX
VSKQSCEVPRSINWSGPFKSVNWRWPVIGMVLITLAIMSLLTASAAAPTPRAQSLLLELAAQHPDTLVSVIVQQTTKDSRVQDMVSSLGGEITKDLYIINGFAANVPAKAVPQLALAQGVRWVSLDARIQQASPTQQKFITWASKLGTATKTTFNDAKNIPSPVGKNGTFGYGSNAKGAFGGFTAEFMPGYSIKRVEVALRAYAPTSLAAKSGPKLTAYVAGKPGSMVKANPSLFNGHTSPATAGTLFVDITSSRTWQWSDFSNDLQLVIDQTGFAKDQVIYYDAVGLRVTTAKGKDPSTALRYIPRSSKPDLNASGWRDISNLQNAYNQTVRATKVWNEAPAYDQGQGVTVALVDSGVLDTLAFDTRLIGQVNFNLGYHDSTDRYGHGTFVAGLVGDNGNLSNGQYVGIAPQSNLVSIRISDDQGMSQMSDVVNGLQWIVANQAAYNIRVVNLSLNSAVYESYMTNPLDAAVEILWFDGLVVVVSAGNNGTASLFPPANDPFVITVGATDDKHTVTPFDDTIAPFSAWGVDETGAVKPDIVAPGTNIVAYLPDNPNLTMSVQHPSNRKNNNYFLLSGTSMAAPLVAGSVAMLLESNPNLNPDQVKYRLKTTANRWWPGYNSTMAGAGLLDIYAAVHGFSTASANTGIQASQLLWTGSTPVTWGSVNWSSVNWSSVNWSSVNWSSVNWSSVNWSSDYFGPIKKK